MPRRGKEYQKYKHVSVVIFNGEEEDV